MRPRQADFRILVNKSAVATFHWVMLDYFTLAVALGADYLRIVGIALPSLMESMGVDITQAGFMASLAIFVLVLVILTQ